MVGERVPEPRQKRLLRQKRIEIEQQPAVGKAVPREVREIDHIRRIARHDGRVPDGEHIRIAAGVEKRGKVQQFYMIVGAAAVEAPYLREDLRIGSYSRQRQNGFLAAA